MTVGVLPVDCVTGSLRFSRQVALTCHCDARLRQRLKKGRSARDWIGVLMLTKPMANQGVL